MNDLSLSHVCEARRENRPRRLSLLLILGFMNGYSIWIIEVSIDKCNRIEDKDNNSQPGGGEAREVYCSFGEEEVARTVRVLKTPEIREGVALDSYADKRPIIAVVKKGRCGHFLSFVESLLSFSFPADTVHLVPLWLILQCSSYLSGPATAKEAM